MLDSLSHIQTTHRLRMHPDDDLQTTLSKWPFIFGDVLLVGTALAIAMLGGWQLTNWQVGACVAAVALGAALFVLPYVVEYYVRVRESQEDRAADLRLLEKHILKAEQELGAIQARMRMMERESTESIESQADAVAMIDEKLVHLVSVHAAQEAAMQALKGELQEGLKAVPPAFDPKVLEPLEARLQALEERPAPPAPPAPEPASEPAEKVSEPEAPSPEPVHVPEVPAKSATPLERPKRTARERRGPEESRLLQRAISDKGDQSSTAVSRIIAAKSTAQKVENVQVPEAESQQPEAVAPESSEAPPETEADAPASASADMLFDADKVAAPLPRTKARKRDAVVTASVFIGIGNKPYLRGSGGGLNWEEGQVMEFEAIGKWRWVAPSDLEEAIQIQVYCNDESPDTSGRYTLDPGQKLDIAPVF